MLKIVTPLSDDVEALMHKRLAVALPFTKRSGPGCWKESMRELCASS